MVLVRLCFPICAVQFNLAFDIGLYLAGNLDFDSLVIIDIVFEVGEPGSSAEKTGCLAGDVAVTRSERKKIRKIRSWISTLMSAAKQNRATTQALMPKKNMTKPGAPNSAKSSTNPTTKPDQFRFHPNRRNIHAGHLIPIISIRFSSTIVHGPPDTITDQLPRTIRSCSQPKFEAASRQGVGGQEYWPVWSLRNRHLDC